MNTIHLNKPNLNSSQTVIINATNNINQILNSTPSKIFKSKNKENIMKRKMNPSYLINSVPAKNSKLTENSVSPNIFNKRKFDQIEKISHQEEIVAQTKFLIYKIDELYDKYSTKIFGKEWKEEFLFELKQENIVDVSEIIPKSLNTRGSHLLEYTKFWILLIEYKFSDLDLIETLSLFDNAILYDQSDFQLLYEYFVKTLEENFEKKEIYASLEKKNRHNHFRVPEKIEHLSRDHFKYLLDKPENFRDIKISRNQFNFTPITNKAQKLLTEIHNINTQSNKIVNKSISNHKVSNLSKNMSTSKFDLYDKNETKVENEVKPHINIISNENREKMNLNSQGVNTNEDYLKEIKRVCYEQLIQRNKYELAMEKTSEVDYGNNIRQNPENKNKDDKFEISSEEFKSGFPAKDKFKENFENILQFDMNEKKLQIESVDKTEKNIALLNSHERNEEEKYKTKEEGEINNKSEVTIKSVDTEIIDLKEPHNKKKKNYKKKKKR